MTDYLVSISGWFNFYQTVLEADDKHDAIEKVKESLQSRLVGKNISYSFESVRVYSEVEE